MTAVKHKAKDFVVEARLLAEAFNLTEDDIRERMRNGVITSRCETGVDEDTGRWRLTFHLGDSACRFIVDAAGTVLKRSTFPIKMRKQKRSPGNGDTTTITSVTRINE